MTIWVDPRIGSRELLPYFSPYGVTVELEKLEFGDVMFQGNGPSGVEFIGIERKIITDLIQSMRSNRLSGHQLRGLLETYQHVELVVEGVFRCGTSGELEINYGRDWRAFRLGRGGRPMMFAEMSHYLMTLENVCGVKVVCTANQVQTVAHIVSVYRWYNDKEWDQHNSHDKIYVPELGDERAKGGGGRRVGFQMRKPPGPVELVASTFPGVSSKAWEFGKVYKRVEDMVNDSVEGLCKVEGIGKVGAQKIHKWLRGG